MNLYRKVLAKHYCPTCKERVRRVREQWGEEMLRSVLAYPVIGFVGLLVGAGIANLGWADGRVAYVLGVLAVSVVTIPFVEQFARYQCGNCKAECTFAQVISRGWIFA